jgi:hypothetical protein
MCPGGAKFETRSASGERGAVLVANLTRPVIDGVSVRVVGIRLGLKFSKPHDKHGNANGEFTNPKSLYVFRFCRLAKLQTELFANQTRRAANLNDFANLS